jgi:hypothetical protein
VLLKSKETGTFFSQLLVNDPLQVIAKGPLSRNSRSIFSNSSTSYDFSKAIPLAEIGK